MNASDSKKVKNTDKDVIYMARAIQLAEKGQYTTHPNPRVGCIIVKEDEIIAEGYHQYAATPFFSETFRP